MAASYPSATKSFTTKTDAPTSTIFAAHVNDLQDEVVAIENALRTGLAHHLLFSPDNTYDIGASGATRPRDLFLARNAVIGGTLDVTGAVSLTAAATFNSAITVQGASNLYGAIALGNASGDTVTVDGTATFNTKPVMTAGVLETGVTTPAQITGDQNNYAPTNGLSVSVWRLASDAARTITGIAAGSAGQRILVINGGGFNIVLANESVSSTAANRMACPGTADVTLNAGDSAFIWYDGTSSRWRVVGF